MPEGPECLVVANAVQVKLPVIFEGATVIENVPDKIHRYSKKKPENWNVIANNRFEMKQARTKGKLILLDIETLPDRQPWVLLITLGMSGDLRWNAANHKHARFSFLQHGKDLSFIDTRCFGTLRIMTPENAREAESKIGWDLLKAPMPKKQWMEIKKLSKIQNKEIGSLLLQQDLFSGLGNIYRCELCYQARIDPKSLVRDLSTAEWDGLNTLAHKILFIAYKKGGSSVKDFTADGIGGSAQEDHKVYGKTVCPKKHLISSFFQDKGSSKRNTWWCKSCQSK